MFGKEKNINKNKQKPDVAPAMNTSPVSKEDVYVMPEKFHPQGSSGSSNKTLIMVLIVLVLVVVSSGSYFLFDMFKRNSANNNTNTNTNNQVVQTNTNENENINRNINRNSNANENSNTNENSNENSNTNENLNDNTNTNDNTNSNQNQNNNIDPIPSGDADRDGLTDLEESLIGSSASSPDSDSDGYLDGQELVAGYNPIVDPASGDPFTLAEASFIDRLTTTFSDRNFTTLYIKGWSVNLIDALHEARIITGTGEMIKISVIDNEDNVSATNWYLLNHTNVSLSQLDSIEFGDFKGVYSPDHLSAYLVDSSKEYLYVLEYDLDNRAEFRYPTVFDMVINNFALVEDVDTNIEGDGGSGDNTTSTQP